MVEGPPDPGPHMLIIIIGIERLIHIGPMVYTAASIAMGTKYLGTVCVPVSRLTFNPPEDLEPDETRCSYQREQLLRLDPKEASQLANIFRQGKCRPSALDNQISGTIEPEEFRRILTLLNISKQELLVLSRKQPLEACEKDSYPFVDGDFTIWCVHGRRRAKAADMAFGKKAWWTVKLFCKSARRAGAIEFNDFVQIENEKFSHEAAYSDGAVYRKVKYYLAKGQIAKVRSWLTKLSFPKRKGLRALLESKCVSQAFDGLLPFVGLWGGLRLGNIHKHLARHFDELIVLYCSHVSEVWDSIFGSYTMGRDFLDLESVRFLEGKAPFVCSNDKRLIEEAMKDGNLLPLISDAGIRKEILSNILKITGIIPSIATLDKNLWYFGFGAQILQKHVEVLPTKLRKERLTLYQNLRNDWRAPSNTTYQLGNEAITVNNPTPEVSFVILFLAALRDFPYLSRESPLKGRRDEKLGGYVDENCRKRFLRLAVRLGFYNHKLQEDIADVPLEAPSEDALTESQHWRYGTPLTQTFKALKNISFLHQLYGLEKRSDGLTPGFVLNDLVRAFFGKFRVLDANGEPLIDSRVHPLNVHIQIPQFPCTITVNTVKILKQMCKTQFSSDGHSKNQEAKAPRPHFAAEKSEQLHDALRRQESAQSPASISLDNPEIDSIRFRETVRESSNEFATQRGQDDSRQVKRRPVPLKFRYNPAGEGLPPSPKKLLSKRPLSESTEYGKEIRTRSDEEPLRKRRRFHSKGAMEGSYELVGDVPEAELQDDTHMTSSDKERPPDGWSDNQSLSNLHATDLTGEGSNGLTTQADPAAPTREKRRSLRVPLKSGFKPSLEGLPSSPKKLLSKRPLSESTEYGKEIRTRSDEEPLRKRRRLHSKGSIHLSKRGIEESAGFHEEIRKHMGGQPPKKRPRRENKSIEHSNNDSMKDGTLLSTIPQPQGTLEETSVAPTVAGATTSLRREKRRSVQRPFRYMPQLDLETLNWRKRREGKKQQRQFKLPFSDVSKDFKMQRYEENLLAMQSGATPINPTTKSSSDEPTAVASPVHDRDDRDDRDDRATEPLENSSSQNRTYSPARDALHVDSNSSQHANRSSAIESTAPILNGRAGGLFDGYSRNEPSITSHVVSPEEGIIDLGAMATLQMQSEYELFPPSSGTDQDEPAAHAELSQSISPTSDDSEL